MQVHRPLYISCKTNGALRIVGHVATGEGSTITENVSKELDVMGTTDYQMCVM